VKHILCAVAFTGSTSQEGDFSFRTCHSFPFNKVDSQRITHGCQPAPVSTFISFGFMLSCDRREQPLAFYQQPTGHRARPPGFLLAVLRCAQVVETSEPTEKWSWLQIFNRIAELARLIIPQSGILIPRRMAVISFLGGRFPRPPNDVPKNKFKVV
jgi:hypothetical protein